MEIFNEVGSVNFAADVYRNIISLRRSQALFDDLSEDPAAQELAQRQEAASRPPQYRSASPLLSRPFEESHYRTVIGYPFMHHQTSRFSRGLHGVWYGALTLQTTVYETAWHWYQFLRNSGDHEHEGVISERRVHRVHCDSHLLDFRPLAQKWPALLANDYSFTHSIGDEMNRKKLPGLINGSARDAGGSVVAAFDPDILSKPRDVCYLSYTLSQQQIRVQRTPGRTLMKIRCRE